MKVKSLTIVMSAYNEEKNIALAIKSCVKLLKETAEQYELLVFNDGSSDRTKMLADQEAAKDPHVKVVHYAENKGPAQITRDAIQMATKDYLTWYPGDYSVDEESMRPIIGSIGKADIICAYTGNTHTRPFVRRCLSSTFTFLFNSLFGLKLRYYNGASVFPVRLLKDIEIKSDRYGFFPEIFIRILKSGNYSYIEMPFYHRPDPETKSKAISLRNIFHVARTTFLLIVDVYFLHQPKGKKKAA